MSSVPKALLRDKVTLEEETNRDMNSEDLKGSEDLVLASTQTHAVSESEDTLESSRHDLCKYSCRRGREAARAINNAAKIHRQQYALSQLEAKAGQVLSISSVPNSNEGAYIVVSLQSRNCL